MPWYTDVGNITGIIGAITGTAGFVLGLIGYRRADAIKSLDLRIELKKAVADARLDLKELPKFVEQVRQSRLAVASVIGTLQSGAMEVWKDQCKADVKEGQKLAADVLSEDHDYSAMSERELESALVEDPRIALTRDASPPAV